MTDTAVAPAPADPTAGARTFLHQCLAAVAEADGSDLHLKVGSPPRVRINGSLRTLGGPPLAPGDTAAMLAAIIPADMLERFDRQNSADFAYSLDGVGRFRVNAFRQRTSSAMVLRRVRTSAADFDELGLPDVVRRLADERRGLVLVTGPTGSGKTTTLAAMIDHINRTRDVHVVTIEDPIEVLHRDVRASINQREVGVDTSGFAAAMRDAMRQDPDVILVGEMRDEETVSAALGAAETGHLVLSTLHTVDATETVNRIVDFFPPHQQNQTRVALAGTLRGVVCQRLVERVGGEGRVAALEILVGNGRVSQCILEPQRGADLREIIADGEYYGMQTFDQSLLRLFERGRVDLRAAMDAATNPADLRLAMQSAGLIGARS